MKRLKPWPSSKGKTKTVTIDKQIKFTSLSVGGKVTIIPKGVYIVSGDTERIK